MYNIILLLAVYGAKNDTGFLRTEAPTPKTMKAETPSTTAHLLRVESEGIRGRGVGDYTSLNRPYFRPPTPLPPTP